MESEARIRSNTGNLGPNGKEQSLVERHAGRPAEQPPGLAGVAQLAGAVYLAPAAWIGLDADISSQQVCYFARQFFDRAFDARAEVETIVSGRWAIVAQNGYQPGGGVVGVQVIAFGCQIAQA